MTRSPDAAPRTTPSAHAPLRVFAGIAIGAAALAAVGARADWEPGRALPAPKRHAVGLLHQGTIYAVGGSPFINGSDMDGTVFRLEGGAWEEWFPLDGVGGALPIGAGVDALDRIVIFGGVDPKNGDTGPTKVYDPNEGPTESLADPPDAAPLEGFAFATDDSGRLYWLGGGPGAGGPNSGWCARYVAAADSWQTIDPMPAAVAEACACNDGNGHLLVFGGFVADGSARTADVKRFDVASGTWSSSAVPDMPHAVSGARAVPGVDGRVYVIGGEDASGAVTGMVQVLHLESNTWSIGASLATPRRDFAAVLGTDDFIHVIGGADASGTELASVERLFTSVCPSLPAPSAVESWSAQVLAIAANASGAEPMSYAWSKDGMPLEDGPTGHGSTIVGAGAATLEVHDVTPADAGTYAVVATNACGSAAGDIATVSVLVPPPVPTQWTVVHLHPSWAKSSVATATSGGMQAGSVFTDLPEYANMSGPVTWSGSAESVVALTPPGSVGGAVADLDDGIAVGWWWWPYQCYVSGQWYTCYSKQAALWAGGPSGFENLQVSGWEYSGASAVVDGIVGGAITNDDAVGNTWTHGGIWTPPNYFFTDLHPSAGASSSSVAALDGGQQFGSILTPYPAPTHHAAMWSGSSGSFVDLHPAGTSASRVVDAADGLQVGTTGYYEDGKACLWNGSKASYRSLHPAGALRSSVTACDGGLQVGTVVLPDGARTAIWSGTAESWVDITSIAPPGYGAATVEDIEVDDDGTVTLVGSAHNTAADRTEALMWISSKGVPGDLDGDGSVGGADLGLLLAAWGTGNPAADLDGDGVVGGADLGVLLAGWTGAG